RTHSAFAGVPPPASSTTVWETTTSPVRRSGCRAPAMPKLTRPVAPWAITLSILAGALCALPPTLRQATPRPRRIFASDLRPVTTTSKRSHPVHDGGGVAALQVPVTRHRPGREEILVAVIAQIEDARKTDRGVVRFRPSAV